MEQMAPKMDAFLEKVETLAKVQLPVTKVRVWERERSTEALCERRLTLPRPAPPRPQAHYPYLLLTAILLELGGGLLFLMDRRLGAQLLVRPSSPKAAGGPRRCVCWRGAQAGGRPARGSAREPPALGGRSLLVYGAEQEGGLRALRRRPPNTRLSLPPNPQPLAVALHALCHPRDARLLGPAAQLPGGDDGHDKRERGREEGLA